MTVMAAAFVNKKVVRGWVRDGQTEIGHFTYRGQDNWTAVPITFHNEFKGLSVFDATGTFVGTVKSVHELP